MDKKHCWYWEYTHPNIGKYGRFFSIKDSDLKLTGLAVVVETSSDDDEDVVSLESAFMDMGVVLWLEFGVGAEVDGERGFEEDVVVEFGGY